MYLRKLTPHQTDQQNNINFKVMDKKDLINKTKDFVAETEGYEDGILGTRWEYAMQLTHRRKKQIIMHERVIDLLAEAALHNINKPNPPTKAE